MAAKLELVAIAVPASSFPASPPAGTSPTTAFPPSSGPGSVITITGGPNATANVPGPHSDPADFWGSALVILVIIAAIALARLVFRRPGPQQPPAEGER